MKILLSSSVWILVKPAYTTALIPVCVVVAFVTKTDDAPKLNDDA